MKEKKISTKEKIPLRDLTYEEIEELFGQLKLPTFRARQVFRWLSKPFLEDFSLMTDLPKELRNFLGQKFSLSLPSIIKKEESKEDGTIKIALKLLDREIIESVIIPERDHYTLCISSQVGCPIGCRFCLTGKMGFRRNLFPHEIIAQVIRAQEILKREKKDHQKPLRNLVFMGMGEPLANLKNVLSALHILIHPLGFDFSPKRITISTVGLVPQLFFLAKEITTKLAISLHAPEDSIRNSLIPINKKYPISALLEACRRFPLKKGWRITFEYTLLKGINASPKQAQKLAQILKGIPSKINLIPFNEHPELPYQRPSEEIIFTFQEILKKEGYLTTIRKSKGKDIQAACGQLRSSLS